MHNKKHLLHKINLIGTKNFCTSISMLNTLISKHSTINSYNGIEVDLEKIIPIESNFIKNYSNAFEEKLKTWENEKIRSITIKIPHFHSNSISYFIEKGFYFHHTKSNYLYICKWLDKSTKNKIPTYAHHHIGIGSCIVNHNLDFLLIKEKYIPSYYKESRIANQKNLKVWKFVTGLIEEEETIIDGIHREIKEEVGLNVNVHGLILLSELYPNNQNISDLCIFNLCSVVNDNDIASSSIEGKIAFDPDELSEAKFFNIKEIDELILNNQTSLLTVQVFNKLKPIFDFSNSLNENLKHFSKNSNFFIPKALKNNNMKFDYLNIYH